MTLTGHKKPLTDQECLALFLIQKTLSNVKAISGRREPLGMRLIHELFRPDKIDSSEPGFSGCVARHFLGVNGGVHTGATADLFLQVAASWDRIAANGGDNTERAWELMEIADDAAVIAADMTAFNDSERRGQILARRTAPVFDPISSSD